MRKFILFTDSFYPNEDATSIYNTQIVNELCIENEITVFCTFGTKSFTGISVNKNKNLHIIRVPIPFNNSRTITGKLIKYIFFSLSILIYLFIKKSSRSTYLIHTSPPILIPIFSFLFFLNKKLFNKRKKIILLAHDIYPDILIVSSKNLNFFKSVVANILENIYSRSYKSFSKIISCSESINYKLNKKYRISNHKLKLIHNWSIIDQDHLKNSTSEKSKLCNLDLILMGNIGNVQLHNLIINRLELIIKKYEINEIKLLIRGLNSKKIIKKLSKYKCINNIGIVNKEHLIDIYKNKSITLVSLSSHVSKCAFPSRISTACFLSSPILFITDEFKENHVAKFISENKIGYTIDNSFSDKQVLIAIKKMEVEYDKLSKNAFITYRKFFDMSYGLKSMIKELE